MGSPDKAIYLLVVEGYADWEPAHAVAELRRHGHYRIETVGLTAAPVQSMGGVTVLPSIDRKSTRLNSSHIPLSRMPSSP